VKSLAKSKQAKRFLQSENVSLNSQKSEFSQIPFSVFCFQKRGRRGGSPRPPSRRRFLLRFIEKKKTAAGLQKSDSFLTIGKRNAEF